jgi:hypothetical protein
VSYTLLMQTLRGQHEQSFVMDRALINILSISNRTHRTSEAGSEHPSDDPAGSSAITAASCRSIKHCGTRGPLWLAACHQVNPQPRPQLSAAAPRKAAANLYWYLSVLLRLVHFIADPLHVHPAPSGELQTLRADIPTCYTCSSPSDPGAAMNAFRVQLLVSNGSQQRLYLCNVSIYFKHG